MALGTQAVEELDLGSVPQDSVAGECPKAQIKANRGSQTGELDHSRVLKLGAFERAGKRARDADCFRQLSLGAAGHQPTLVDLVQDLGELSAHAALSFSHSVPTVAHWEIIGTGGYQALTHRLSSALCQLKWRNFHRAADAPTLVAATPRLLASAPASEAGRPRVPASLTLAPARLASKFVRGGP